MRRIAVTGIALLLAGCAHEIALTPADGVGPVGHGQAPWKVQGSRGPLSIQLGDKLYRGDYVLQTGGFVGTGTALFGTQLATGTMMGADANGNGMAYLTEPGGTSMTCNFSFSSLSSTGLGHCRTSDGHAYNMMIR